MPQTMPAAVTVDAAVWDPARRQLVAVGTTGSSPADATGHAETWDGTTWTVQQVPASFVPYPQVIVDPVTGLDVVLSRGALGPDSTTLDTWGWDGHRWRRLGASPLSSGRGWDMVADPAHHRVVAFEMSDGIADSDAEWSWNGARWTVVPGVRGTPPNEGDMVPAPDAGHLLLLDPHAQSVEDAHAPAAWSWNGGSWDVINTSGGPDRWHFAVAWEPHQHEVLALTGDHTSTPISICLPQLCNEPASHTWTFRDGSWTEQYVGTAPPRPQFLVYDGTIDAVLAVCTDGTMWRWRPSR